MFALTPIAPTLFDKLIAKSEHNRRQMKQRGQLQPLIVATPEQRADGLWREQILLVADAVIMVLIDMLIEAGAKRAQLDDAVMHALQLEMISRFHDIDEGKSVVLAFAHDGRRWLISSAATVNDVMQATAEHFIATDETLAKFGVTVTPRVSFYCAPLHEALATVRTRAAEHDIQLPERIWPTPDELDAGAGLLAAAIAPRTSPIIEKWQASRQSEAAADVLQ
ncbi:MULTISPECIES: hypothetical protein [Bradyrhizobium]|nr:MULTISPECIES: hypothetical protein [Bradyrhizobium]MBR1000104.1 hypothetical protein [Bradyrhizobium liaoningense]